jgi:hypothetical protein
MKKIQNLLLHTLGINMKYKVLDTVVLQKDIPENNLSSGDLGVIVEIYSLNDIEVEFITGNGHTQALLALKTNNVRLVLGSDILSVRSLDIAA